MISFIVIGQNEGWKLTKCFESIFETITLNSILDSEVIYIDSNSSDDSIKRATHFDKVKVFKLKADKNAAIARNVGVKKSIGDVIFFIDGDMEIIHDFLPLVYSEKSGLTRDFISGNWVNYFYDSDNNYVAKKKFLILEADIIENTTGGLFLIKRTTWEMMGGMRSMFKKSQDIDLGLRLAKKKKFLLRKKEIAANHHTIAYHDKNRIWKELKNHKHLYGRSLLYREHFFNKYMYRRFLRNEYSLIIFILSLLLLFLTGSSYGLVLYFILLLLRSKLKLDVSLYFFLRDIIVLFGFFFFYPKRKFDVKVEEV